MPDGIDVYGDRIYWTDMGSPKVFEGQIFSAKLDGSDIQTVVPKGKIFTPKQLIIDQKSKKAYFCDREGCRVMRVNLDGSELETLVQTADWEKETPEETQWCVGIAVSQNLGKVSLFPTTPSSDQHTDLVIVADLLDAERAIQRLPSSHFLRRTGNSQRPR